MDVGNPSNFARMMDLYHNNYEDLKKDVAAYAFTDAETKAAMQSIFQNKGYILDPHGAVGYLGIKKFMKDNNASDVNGIFLETAHPGKFLEVVEDTLNQKVELPAALKRFLLGTKKTIPATNDFSAFKKTLKQLL